MLEPGDQVRFRPTPQASSEEAQWLLARVPGSTWDAGLEDATRQIAQAAANRNSRITPNASQLATARAGYPGYARFAKRVTGGGFPDELAEELSRAALQRTQPVDIAMARRDFADGITLWIGAIAHRPALLDPIPRDIPLDELLPVHVEIPAGTSSSGPFAGIPNPVLFVTRPSGRVSSHDIQTGNARYLDIFHTPGLYQLELVARAKRNTQVVLSWSHFVETQPDEIAPLPPASNDPVDPMQAADELYTALNLLRSNAGTPPLKRFESFEPLAREHAAYMAASGVLGHRIINVTEGVAARAARGFHPRALHHEDLATAPTWQEALESTRLSPGHLANLLCDTCTHASIGVAIEPVTNRTPRIFVVWELLEFPEGPPIKIPVR